MKRQLFTLFVVLFLAAFGSASRVRQANAAETVATVPSDVSARMNEVLAQAHKTWRKDAIVTQVDLQWYPQQLPTAQFGLVMRLYSPSNRMERTVTLGGPQDGSVLDLGRNLNDNSPTRPIPDFKIDLPDAFVAASRAGVSGIMFSVRLAMIGAKGTPPILAWQFQPVEFRPYPLPIDAQTGASKSAGGRGTRRSSLATT